MNALYIMKYVGQAGIGGGSLYIGKGVIAGVDVTGGRFDGHYIEKDGRIKGVVKMTMPPGGAELVTGQQVAGGATFELSFDFSLDFESGTPQLMEGVGGHPVQVTFEKIRDLPN